MIYYVPLKQYNSIHNLSIVYRCKDVLIYSHLQQLDSRKVAQNPVFTSL